MKFKVLVEKESDYSIKSLITDKGWTFFYWVEWVLWK